MRSRPATVALALLLTASCSSSDEASPTARARTTCLQQGFSDAVCTCASEAMAATLAGKEGAALEADGISRELDGHIARCMISTGALTDEVTAACREASPIAQKAAETCACFADKLARDERVRDILDREDKRTLPRFAEEVLFTCARDHGALDALFKDTCGGNFDSPHCACLKERFSERFPPAALVGMSQETLRANVTDVSDRCVVDAPHIRDGLLAACRQTEKKGSVCDCAVSRFLESVPPRDVLTILQGGWTSDTMAELLAAQRACGGKSAKPRRR